MWQETAWLMKQRKIPDLKAVNCCTSLKKKIQMWAELDGFISSFCAALIAGFLPCWVVFAMVDVFGGFIRRVRWSLLASAPLPEAKRECWPFQESPQRLQIIHCNRGFASSHSLGFHFWLTGSVNGWLGFGVSAALLEGEGEIQAATRANSLNGGLPFSSVFVLFVWLVIRCTAVEFAWSRDLHELLFFATCTSVQTLSPCSTVPEHPFAEGFVCSGQQKPSAWGEGRLQW